MCTDNDNLCPVNIGSKSVVLLPPVVVVWLHLTCGCVDDAVDTRLDGSQSARAAAQRSGAAQSTRPTQRSSAAQRCRATQGSCAAQTACRTQGVVWSVVFLQWCQKSTSLKCHKLVMSNFLFSTFFFVRDTNLNSTKTVQERIARDLGGGVSFLVAFVVLVLLPFFLWSLLLPSASTGACNEKRTVCEA